MKNTIPIEKIGIYGKKPTLDIVFNAHAHLKKHFQYLKESVQYPDEVQMIWDIWRRSFDAKGAILRGDCDEFMLQIIYILWMCKVPEAYLYLSVGLAPTGEGHAIPHVMVGDTLWQCDNMLQRPLPSFYAYNCVGYGVNEYSNGIFNLEEKQWRQFVPSAITPPCEMRER